VRPNVRLDVKLDVKLVVKVAGGFTTVLNDADI